MLEPLIKRLDDIVAHWDACPDTEPGWPVFDWYPAEFFEEKE